MLVDFGDYILEGECFNYILSRKIIYKEGKRAGKTYFKVLGYYARAEDMIDDLIDKNIKESQATSLRKIKKEVIESRQELKGYCREIEENLIKKVIDLEKQVQELTKQLEGAG